MTRWHHRALCGALALGLAASGAGDARALEVDLDGRLRFRATALSDFHLDADGFAHGQRRFGTLLLRLAPEIRFTEDILVHAEVQLLDGQLFGDDSHVGGEAIIRPWRETHILDQLRLREAYVQLPVYIGVLRVGRMASDWGLGMLANGGDREDFLFADVTHGDIVNRAAFITRPLEPLDLGVVSRALHLVLAGDLVERDELTDREAGDLAWQAVAAVLWRQPKLEAGLYVAYRDLERDNGARIRATAVDLFGKWSLEIADRFELDLAFEGAVVTGETNELEFEDAPRFLDILQTGFVLRADFEDHHLDLDYRLELGFASGDNATQDETLRGFRFDPAYKAGMILFEEVLGRTSARGADRASDPALAGTPPKGIERAPTNGSITNAAYLYPQVTWSPLDGLVAARLGVLLAFSAGDVVDPYASAEVGGYNANPYGKVNAHGALGYELNLGADVQLSDEDAGLGFRLGAQYGVFVPGPALGAAPGVEGLSALHKLRLVSDVRW